MAFAQTCNIEFKKNERRESIRLTQVTEIVIETSWNLLTATAEIVLPRNIKTFDKQKVKEIFRKGDAVIISFGYDGKNNEEFRGYISEISADIPIRIKMQDEMWKLKQIEVNYSSPNVSLQEFLNTILPGYSIDALEGVQLGSIRFSKTTASEVLEKLKQDPWKLSSYFITKGGKPTLVCGKNYSDNDSVSIPFHLERNCVSQSLNYVRKDDISVLIKGVSTLNDGTKIEVEYGDKNGQTRQLVHYNKTKSELEVLVKLDYEKYKQDRFDGTFIAFGIPSVAHGARITLRSGLYEDRNGTYLVEGVTKTFGKDGIRQVIKLDARVD